MSKNAKRFDRDEDHGLIIRRQPGEGVQVGSETLRVLACQRGQVLLDARGRRQQVRPGESFALAGVWVKVLDCGLSNVRLMFTGPRDVKIWREEIALLIA